MKKKYGVPIPLLCRNIQDNLKIVDVYSLFKGNLLQSWKTTLETNAEDTLVEWLNELYDLLLSTWHAQVTYFKIFLNI